MIGDYALICEKCGSALSPTKKCYNCGHDNSNVKDVEITPDSFNKASVYRSTRVTIFMVLCIAIDIIMILLVVGDFFNHEVPLGYKIFAGVLTAMGAFDIVLCVFILKLKKWALTLYIALNVVSGVLRIFTGDIISIIFKALLLYFIFRNDWDYFE